MIVSFNPKAGDGYTLYDCRWVWQSPAVERGHWKADDHTSITIFPASDGITDIMVCIPNGDGKKETVAHFPADALETAFHYGASARRARGH